MPSSACRPPLRALRRRPARCYHRCPHRREAAGALRCPGDETIAQTFRRRAVYVPGGALRGPRAPGEGQRHRATRATEPARLHGGPVALRRRRPRRERDRPHAHLDRLAAGGRAPDPRLHHRAPLHAGAGLALDGAVADPPRDARQLALALPGARAAERAPARGHPHARHRAARRRLRHRVLRQVARRPGGRPAPAAGSTTPPRAGRLPAAPAASAARAARGARRHRRATTSSRTTSSPGSRNLDGDDFYEIWLCSQAEAWLRRTSGRPGRSPAAARARGGAGEQEHPPFACVVSLAGAAPRVRRPRALRRAATTRGRCPCGRTRHDDLTDKPAPQRLYRDAITSSGSLSDDEWRTCIARYYAFCTLIDDQLGRLLGTLRGAGRRAGHAGAVRHRPRRPDRRPPAVGQGAVPLRGADPHPLHRPPPRGAARGDALRRLRRAARPDADPGRGPGAVASPGPVDGRSLWAQLRGRPAPPDWPDDAYVQYHGEGIGLYSIRALRTAGHKYVYYPFDRDELYDLEADPWEFRNLAARPGIGGAAGRPAGPPGAAHGGGGRRPRASGTTA